MSMKKLCTSCGKIASPALHTRGSFGIEIILWLCLILPGILYSLWRLSSRIEVCAACGSANIIPVNSPAAEKIAMNLGVDIHAIDRRALSARIGRWVGKKIKGKK
jgi:hypothetical protein